MSKRDNERLPWRPLLARYLDRCQSPADVTLPTFVTLTLLSWRLKKRLFGGEYVTLGDTLRVFAQVCEVGGLIGSRSDGDLVELAKLVSRSGGSGDTVDWSATRYGLEVDLELHRLIFVSPPPSLIILSMRVAYINLDVGWPGNRGRIEKVLERKMGVNDRMIEMTLSSASVSFNQGIVFGVTYPNVYSDMHYEMQKRDDARLDTPMVPKSAEHYEFLLGLCNEWAQICRPDLAHLLEGSSLGSMGLPLTQRGDPTQRRPNLTQVDYEQMGLPAGLASRLNSLASISHFSEREHLSGIASRLNGLASAGLVNAPSLPWFLCLAYVYENSTSGSSGKDIMNFGRWVATEGAIFEIGGIIGESAEIDAVSLLSLTVDPAAIRPMLVEEFWQEVCQRSHQLLEIYSTDYGVDPPGFLPFFVYHSYKSRPTDFPNGVEPIFPEHDDRWEFWAILENNLEAPVADGVFASGVAFGRNHPDTFAGKHGVYTNEDPDPITGTYANPQDETNLKIGSTYTREEQLNLCRVWADLFRPEAKPIIDTLT